MRNTNGDIAESSTLRLLVRLYGYLCAFTNYSLWHDGKSAYSTWAAFQKAIEPDNGKPIDILSTDVSLVTSALQSSASIASWSSSKGVVPGEAIPHTSSHAPTSSVGLSTRSLQITKLPTSCSKLFDYGVSIVSILSGLPYATHWGIQLGKDEHTMYADLKRCAGLRSEHGYTRFNISSLRHRQEGPILQTVKLGQTHLNNNQIRDIGKHLLTHYPLYLHWERNCQTFAVRQLAAAILCPTCPQEPDNGLVGPTNAFYSIYAITAFHDFLLLMLEHAFLSIVIRSLFELPETVAPLHLLAFTALVIGFTFIIALVPSPKHRTRPRAKEYLGATLFDWELEHLPQYQHLPPVDFVKTSREAKCGECAKFAAMRYRFTRSCIDAHRNKRDNHRGSAASSVLLKALLTFPIWSTPLFMGLLLDSAFHSSVSYGICLVAFVVLVMIALTYDLHDDTCKTGFGFYILYQKGHLNAFLDGFAVVYVWIRRIGGLGYKINHRNVGILRYLVYLASVGYLWKPLLLLVVSQSDIFSVLWPESLSQIMVDEYYDLKTSSLCSLGMSNAHDIPHDGWLGSGLPRLCLWSSALK
ncbi:hypothetical protein F5Y13DRAFT_197651 [Hypoxylon sp. FL1857]|nr:hypothetical protein F5Y13DRAFT_197651 [Hypoxylon sp. FL1857]